MELVEGPNLYSRFCLGVPFQSKRPNYGLEFLPHKEEGKEIIEGDTTLFILDNLEGKGTALYLRICNSFRAG